MVVPKKELELCQRLEFDVKILETEHTSESEKVLAPSPRPMLLINFASYIFPASTGVRKALFDGDMRHETSFSHSLPCETKANNLSN